MDRITPQQRSRIMSRIPSSNTQPELKLRRLLHGLGYRFRLHARDLPGNPDVVLRPRRAAVFLHGCFWHGHACRWGRPVKSNASYWAAKIERNQRRDSEALAKLREQGWRPLVVWECELRDLEAVERTLVDFLGPSGPMERRSAVGVEPVRQGLKVMGPEDADVRLQQPRHILVGDHPL